MGEENENEIDAEGSENPPMVAGSTSSLLVLRFLIASNMNYRRNWSKSRRIWRIVLVFADGIVIEKRRQKRKENQLCVVYILSSLCGDKDVSTATSELVVTSFRRNSLWSFFEYQWKQLPPQKASPLLLCAASVVSYWTRNKSKFGFITGVWHGLGFITVSGDIQHESLMFPLKGVVAVNGDYSCSVLLIYFINIF